MCVYIMYRKDMQTLTKIEIITLDVFLRSTKFKGLSALTSNLSTTTSSTDTVWWSYSTKRCHLSCMYEEVVKVLGLIHFQCQSKWSSIILAYGIVYCIESRKLSKTNWIFFLLIWHWFCPVIPSGVSVILVSFDFSWRHTNISVHLITLYLLGTFSQRSWHNVLNNREKSQYHWCE